MRTRLLLVAAVLGATALSGCGGDDDAADPAGGELTSFPPPAPTPSRSPSTILTTGKSLVPLDAGTFYQSPDGFIPKVTVNVMADGWVSTHRSLDAFDLSQPLPDADAALVVYAFVVPPEETSEKAMAAIADRAADAGATVERTGDLTVTVTGGQGPLVTSRDGGIALDAVATGYTRITTNPGEEPFLTVWWVPDSAYQDEAEGLSHTLGVVFEFPQG